MYTFDGSRRRILMMSHLLHDVRNLFFSCSFHALFAPRAGGRRITKQKAVTVGALLAAGIFIKREVVVFTVQKSVRVPLLLVWLLNYFFERRELNKADKLTGSDSRLIIGRK